MDSKTFRKKAEKIGLSLYIWFNLLLVYRKARPACLFSGKEIDKEKRKKVLELFPFFKVYSRPSYPNSYFFYINEKVIEDGLKYSDIKLLQTGYILGFSCPGEMGGGVMSSREISYLRNFRISDTISIYGEVCWDKKSFDRGTLKKIQKVADDFGWKIEEDIDIMKNRLYTGKNIRLVNGGSSPSLVKKWKKFDSYDQALRSLKLKNVLPPSIAKTYKEGVEYYYHLNKHNEKSEKENGVFAIWI